MIWLLTPKTILDENYCVCMLRNANTVFVFWKFSDYYLSLFENKNIPSEIRIKLINEENKILADLPSIYSKSVLHIEVPTHAKKVKIDIYCFENGIEKILCSSNVVNLASERDFKKDYNFYNEKN